MLANISAENIQVKHISAKLPSPILEYVDFSSRNQIKCENINCSICKESENPDVTYFGQTIINDQNQSLYLSHITTNMWRDI